MRPALASCAKGCPAGRRMGAVITKKITEMNTTQTRNRESAATGHYCDVPGCNLNHNVMLSGEKRDLSNYTKAMTVSERQSN